MKRLALVLAVAALALPAAAPAAYCSPLSCAPSEWVLAHGSLLATRATVQSPIRVIDLTTGATRLRLPAGVVAGRTLVTRSGQSLTWRDLVDGSVLGRATLHLHGRFGLAGLSQDGTEAVLERNTHGTSTFAIVSPGRVHFVGLRGGTWGFDALSGSSLVLVKTVTFGYEVFRYDLAVGRLDRTPLKDPGEPALISGLAFSRVASPDGRYLFTLYISGGNGTAMIHELDLRNGTARCIDLPGGGDANAAITYALAVSRDGRTLWAVSPGFGRAVAIDVAAARVRAQTTFLPGDWTGNAGIAAVSQDQRQMAVSDAQHTWLVDLATLKVTRWRSHVALALAFSPDGARLLGVGERSRVFALRVHR